MATYKKIGNGKVEVLGSLKGINGVYIINTNDGSMEFVQRYGPGNILERTLVTVDSNNKYTLDPQYYVEVSAQGLPRLSGGFNKPILPVNGVYTSDQIRKDFFLSAYTEPSFVRAVALNTASNYPNNAAYKQRAAAFAKKGIAGVKDPTTKISSSVNSLEPNPPKPKVPVVEESPAPVKVDGTPIIAENPGGSAVAAPKPSGFTTKELDGILKNLDIDPTGDLQKEIDALRAPKVYRYPLANLEVASEIGINFDFLRIRTVDHISSLKGDLTGKKEEPTSTSITLDNYTIRPTAGGESLAEAYFQSQRVKEYIILPMQPNISSSNAVDWGSDSMNIAKLVGGQMLNNYFNNTAEKGAVDAFKQVLISAIQQGGNLADMAVSNKSSIAALLAGSLVNGNLLQRATGTVINPNMEMLFNGPRLRTFNFQFDFTPRSKKEAEEIRAIIATLKYRMSPRRTAGNAFLRSPHIFLLDYIYNGGGSTDQFTNELRSDEGLKKFTMNTHPYLNKIKPCALVDMNVNYTPDGSYMTYKDGGSMTRYSINMSFAEIEPIYANDYETSTYKGQFSGKERKAFNTKEMGY